MILVGGFNSSIDKYMETDAVRVGGVARVRNVRAFPGGKGLHVALAVAALGEKVRLTGIIDPAHRAMFTAFLNERAVDFEAIPVDEEIRTCLAVRDGEGRMTELLEPGPRVSSETGEALCSRYVALAHEADLAVLSGSLPRGVPETAYGDLIRDLPGVRVLLDASGAALRAGVAARPFLAKPNREEIRELTGMPVLDVEGACEAVLALGDRGVSLVALSLGETGAMLGRAGDVFLAQPPRIEAHNPVGSGDCFLGGVAVGLLRRYDLPEVLRLGVACGAANALRPETGRLQRGDVEDLLPKVNVARFNSATGSSR